MMSAPARLRPRPARPRSLLPSLRRSAGLLGLLLVVPGLALAADRRPTLRPAVSVSADLVTIGDFFENAGTLSDRAIFRAPDLGTTGSVPAWRVVAEAKAAGLVDPSEGNIVEVTVSRSAREITSAEIQAIVVHAVARQMGVQNLDELQVTFDQPLEPRIADERSGQPIRVTSVAAQPGGGRFEVLLQVDKGGATEKFRLRGQAQEVTETVTLVRPFNRGEIVREEDLAVERVPKRQVGAVRPVSPADFVGLAARRTLRQGQPLATADFTAPLLVNRGEIVTIVYESPGLVLTARGQALEQGAKGDTITVLNQLSKRTLVGQVTAPGRVTITAGPGGGPVAALDRRAAPRPQ